MWCELWWWCVGVVEIYYGDEKGKDDVWWWGIDVWDGGGGWLIDCIVWWYVLMCVLWCFGVVEVDVGEWGVGGARRVGGDVGGRFVDGFSVGVFICRCGVFEGVVVSDGIV